MYGICILSRKRESWVEVVVVGGMVFVEWSSYSPSVHVALVMDE